MSASPLNTDEILVDGQIVNLIHVGQGDVEGSTVFHVPSADGVVVHGMLGLHGERDQPHTLWISARAELSRRS
jgi:hypothetical protein